MEVDFSVELGRDDPTLEIPWSEPEGRLRYFNLKLESSALVMIPEAAQFPELRAFLMLLNSPGSPLESAKCDTWSTAKLQPEEEIFGEPWKFAVYVAAEVKLLNALGFEKFRGVAGSCTPRGNIQ